MIKHQNGKWVLFSKDGKKRLGSFDTEAEAEAREKEINALKHMGLVEIPLIITKASLHPDGSMRWQAVVSDTEPDKFNEQTSIPLFEDWISRSESGESVPFLPPPRRPFLGISHYPDLDGFGEAGTTEKMYIDGKCFKASGFFNDNPVGRAFFETVRRERELAQKGNFTGDPVRISAAWWDLAHSHGDFIFERKSLDSRCPICEKAEPPKDTPKQFLKGQPDHFAGTRVPVNPRTSLDLEEKAMAKTRKEDAASIIGDELAQALDEKDRPKIGKSETESTPALVIKADDPLIEKMPLGGATNMADAAEFLETEELREEVFTNFDIFMAVMGNIMGGEHGPDFNPVEAIKMAVKDFGERVAALKADLGELAILAPQEVLKSSGGNIMSDEKAPAEILQESVSEALQAEGSREEKAAQVQGAIDSYLETVKAELDAVAPPDSGEIISKAVTEAMQPVVDQLGVLIAKMEKGFPQAQAPTQKSFTPAGPVIPTAPGEKPISPITGKESTLTAMIRRSVGIQQ